MVNCRQGTIQPLIEHVCCTTQADDIDGHDVSVRKKLSFESEEDNASSSKSWYQYSSESDWLQSGGIELDDASEPEDKFLPPLSSPPDLPEESSLKGTTQFFKMKLTFKEENTWSHRRRCPRLRQGEGAQTSDGSRTDGLHVR